MNILEKKTKVFGDEQKKAAQEAYENAKKDAVDFQKAFKYALSQLDGAVIKTEVREIENDDLANIESLYDEEFMLDILSEQTALLSVEVTTDFGTVIEKVYTFDKQNIEAAVGMAVNVINSLIQADFEEHILDDVRLSGKRTLYINETVDKGNLVSVKNTGVLFTKAQIAAFDPFEIETIEKVNYEGTDKEIVYEYNEIKDPMNNSIKVFLINTDKGQVAKIKKGSFGLISGIKSMNAIEIKFLRKVVEILESLNIEIALEGPTAKDLGIWDNVDESTLTNQREVQNETVYAEIV